MKSTTIKKEEKTMRVTVKTPRTVKVIPTLADLDRAFHSAMLEGQRELDLFRATGYTCHLVEADNWQSVAKGIADKIVRGEYV
jgi:hypothetical protein